MAVGDASSALKAEREEGIAIGEKRAKIALATGLLEE